MVTKVGGTEGNITAASMRILEAVGTYFPNRWVQAAVILAAFFVFAAFLLLIERKIIKKITGKTKTTLDDLLVDKTRVPLLLLILMFGMQTALIPLDINGAIKNIVWSIVTILFMYLVGVIFTSIIIDWGQHFAKRTHTQIDDTLLPLFKKIIAILLVLISFLWILRIWEVNITPYLAGLGIGGVILGLALQDTFKNVFSGISLVLDKNIKVNDKVRLESGEVGEVHEISLRSTKIRTYNNEMLVVPNGKLADMRFINYTQPNDRIRVVAKFTTAYGVKIEHVKKLILEAIRKKMKGIEKEPEPAINFESMGDFALQFQALFWVDDWRNAYDKEKEALELIYNTLKKANIEIPYPTRTVYVKKWK